MCVYTHLTSKFLYPLDGIESTHSAPPFHPSSLDSCFISLWAFPCSSLLRWATTFTLSLWIPVYGIGICSGSLQSVWPIQLCFRYLIWWSIVVSPQYSCRKSIFFSPVDTENIEMTTVVSHTRTPLYIGLEYRELNSSDQCLSHGTELWEGCSCPGDPRSEFADLFHSLCADEKRQRAYRPASHFLGLPSFSPVCLSWCMSARLVCGVIQFIQDVG